MTRLRDELLPLGLPVLVCVAAWAVIVSRPAAPAHHTPTPRAPVTLERHPQRPPTPLPPAAPVVSDGLPVSDTEAPAAAPAAPVTATAPTVPEAIEIEVLGGSVNDEVWIDDGYDSPWLARWVYYYRRDWMARREEWLRQRARRVRTQLMPGDVAFEDNATGSPLCAYFRAACGSSVRRASVPANVVSDDTHVATVTREGRVWRLANGHAEATIDPEARCAVQLHAIDRDPMPALTFEVPADATCAVTETLPADTAVDHGGAALAIVWSAPGWTQRAVLSLADSAARPEVSLARSAVVDGRTVTLVTNLTTAPLTWTFGARDVTVAPAESARVTQS